MKRYLVFSGGGHVVLVVLWLTSGALLSKPPMSYYSIDMVSSLPGGRSGGGAAVTATPAPAVKDVETPKAPSLPPAKEERKLPASEVIQVKGKPKKPTAPPPRAQPQKKHGINLKAALGVLEGQNAGRGSGTGSNRGGSGIVTGEGGIGAVGTGGEPFPFPWYLQSVFDRLDKQWKPPHDFQEDTKCQIVFVISRGGQVSDIRIKRASGDTTFDELAKRAVLYSNPLPPLPDGYPEETLNVYITFVGK